MGRSSGSECLVGMRHINSYIIIAIKAALQRFFCLAVSHGQRLHIPVHQTDADIEMVLSKVLCHGENFITNREQGLRRDCCIAVAYGDNSQQGVFFHCHDISGAILEGQGKKLANGSQEPVIFIRWGRAKCILDLQIDSEIILQLQTQLS
ncbi:hypothetical protein D3C73_1111490 [compost metagenome]